MNPLLVLHGPNLNLLGQREPEIYGSTTLDKINNEMSELASQNNIALTIIQTNKEHELIDQIQSAKASGYQYIIINPAAFAHTSIALRDALIACGVPFTEVHISNIFAREPFRQHSYLSDIAKGVITGLGPYGYTLALLATVNYFNTLS